MAVRRLRHGARRSRLEGALLAVSVSAALVLLGYRAGAAGSGWQPLNSHVDGLLLLTGLVGLIIGYLHWAGRLRGADVFGLPILLLMLAWGVCASWWTFRPFHAADVWGAVHIVSVYISTAGVVLAGAMGLMYLFVRRQLRRRDGQAERLRALSGMASLERVEWWLMRAAALAFVTLTLAVGLGLASMAGAGGEAMGGVSDWAKVAGGVVIWLLFALLVQARWLPGLGGRGAAWLSIVALALTITVMAMAL